ncbi:MAG: hypothetical protein Q8K75_00315 [Chlamydiales bacterium]|nr:hypothetical protein [Chlamydiales bacterium]
MDVFRLESNINFVHPRLSNPAVESVCGEVEPEIPQLPPIFAACDQTRIKIEELKLVDALGLPITELGQELPLLPNANEMRGAFFEWLKIPLVFPLGLEGVEDTLQISIHQCLQKLLEEGDKVLGPGRTTLSMEGGALLWWLGEEWVRKTLRARGKTESEIDSLLTPGLRAKLATPPNDFDFRVFFKDANDNELQQIIAGLQIYLVEQLPENICNSDAVVAAAFDKHPILSKVRAEGRLHRLVMAACFRSDILDPRGQSRKLILPLTVPIPASRNGDMNAPMRTIDIACAAELRLEGGFDEDQGRLNFTLDEQDSLQPTGGDTYKGHLWLTNRLCEARQLATSQNNVHDEYAFIRRVIQYSRGERSLHAADNQTLVELWQRGQDSLSLMLSKSGGHFRKHLGNMVALTFQSCVMRSQECPDDDLSSEWNANNLQFNPRHGLWTAPKNAQDWKAAGHPLLSMLGLALCQHKFSVAELAAALQLIALAAVCLTEDGRIKDHTQVKLITQGRSLAYQFALTVDGEVVYLLIPCTEQPQKQIKALLKRKGGPQLWDAMTKSMLADVSFSGVRGSRVHHYLRNQGIALTQLEAKEIGGSLSLRCAALTLDDREKLDDEFLLSIPSMLFAAKDDLERGIILDNICAAMPELQCYASLKVKQTEAFYRSLWAEVLIDTQDPANCQLAYTLFKGDLTSKITKIQAQTADRLIKTLALSDMPKAVSLLLRLSENPGDDLELFYQCSISLCAIAETMPSANRAGSMSSLGRCIAQLVKRRAAKPSGIELQQIGWLVDQLIEVGSISDAMGVLEVVIPKAGLAHDIAWTNRWVLSMVVQAKTGLQGFSESVQRWSRGARLGINCNLADVESRHELVSLACRHISDLGARSLEDDSLVQMLRCHPWESAEVSDVYAKRIRAAMLERKKSHAVQNLLTSYHGLISPAVAAELLPDVLDYHLHNNAIKNAAVVLEGYLGIAPDPQLARRYVSLFLTAAGKAGDLTEAYRVWNSDAVKNLFEDDIQNWCEIVSETVAHLPPKQEYTAKQYKLVLQDLFIGMDQSTPELDVLTQFVLRACQQCPAILAGIDQRVVILANNLCEAREFSSATSLLLCLIKGNAALHEWEAVTANIETCILNASSDHALSLINSALSHAQTSKHLNVSCISERLLTIAQECVVESKFQEGLDLLKRTVVIDKSPEILARAPHIAKLLFEANQETLCLETLDLVPHLPNQLSGQELHQQFIRPALEKGYTKLTHVLVMRYHEDLAEHLSGDDIKAVVQGMIKNRDLKSVLEIFKNFHVTESTLWNEYWIALSSQSHLVASVIPLFRSITLAGTDEQKANTWISAIRAIAKADNKLLGTLLDEREEILKDFDALATEEEKATCYHHILTNLLSHNTSQNTLKAIQAVFAELRAAFSEQQRAEIEWAYIAALIDSRDFENINEAFTFSKNVPIASNAQCERAVESIRRMFSIISTELLPEVRAFFDIHNDLIPQEHLALIQALANNPSGSILAEAVTRLRSFLLQASQPMEKSLFKTAVAMLERLSGRDEALTNDDFAECIQIDYLSDTPQLTAVKLRIAQRRLAAAQEPSALEESLNDAITLLSSCSHQHADPQNLIEAAVESCLNLADKANHPRIFSTYLEPLLDSLEPVHATANLIRLTYTRKWKSSDAVRGAIALAIARTNRLKPQDVVKVRAKKDSAIAAVKQLVGLAMRYPIPKDNGYDFDAIVKLFEKWAAYLPADDRKKMSYVLPGVGTKPLRTNAEFVSMTSDSINWLLSHDSPHTLDQAILSLKYGKEILSTYLDTQISLFDKILTACEKKPLYKVDLVYAYNRLFSCSAIDYKNAAMSYDLIESMLKVAESHANARAPAHTKAFLTARILFNLMTGMSKSMLDCKLATPTCPRWWSNIERMQKLSQYVCRSSDAAPGCNLLVCALDEFVAPPGDDQEERLVRAAEFLQNWNDSLLGTHDPFCSITSIGVISTAKDSPCGKKWDTARYLNSAVAIAKSCSTSAADSLVTPREGESSKAAWHRLSRAILLLENGGKAGLLASSILGQGWFRSWIEGAETILTPDLSAEKCLGTSNALYSALNEWTSVIPASTLQRLWLQWQTKLETHQDYNPNFATILAYCRLKSFS